MINIYTIDDFKEGNLAVHCDSNEKAELFFELLRENDIVWGDGCELINNKWERFRTETCYRYDRYGLLLGRRFTYSFSDMSFVTIISVDSFLNNPVNVDIETWENIFNSSTSNDSLIDNM